MESEPGKLYLVPTPIGNLEDITQRALRVLGEVDLVACEDTRTTGQLLFHYGIKKKLISYHEYNERRQAGSLANEIAEGKSVAVVTDAGTPGISDPAYRIVRASIDAGIEVIALPGASALLPALTASGLPTDRFHYEGFLSPKTSARKRRIEELRDYKHTLVFYESPHRLVKCLEDMREVLGDRPVCVAREISKKFEEFSRGTLSEVIGSFKSRAVKGEIVIVVAGDNPKLFDRQDEEE